MATTTTLDLTTGAEFFRHLGWPVSVDQHRQRLIVATGDVLDVLILPAALGKRVSTALNVNMMSGPISIDSDGRWWTIVTEPCQKSNVDIPAILKTARAHAVPRGGYAVIPHPDTAGWVQLPRSDRSLPPWHTVVALTRTALETQH